MILKKYICISRVRCLRQTWYKTTPLWCDYRSTRDVRSYQGRHYKNTMKEVWQDTSPTMQDETVYSAAEHCSLCLRWTSPKSKLATWHVCRGDKSKFWNISALLFKLKSLFRFRLCFRNYVILYSIEFFNFCLLFWAMILLLHPPFSNCSSCWWGWKISWKDN